MKLTERLTRAWYQGQPLLLALSPLEWLYRAVVVARRRRFLQGKGDIYRAPVPVIVVGNLTLGGTGKTPLTLWLVQHCQQRGIRVGVVSRGYGAKPAAFPHWVRADEPAAQAGDEPLLMVQRSGVPLVIDPQRSRAVQTLLAGQSVDLVLCDDGLQHYRLARDLELVLVDASRGLGNGHCLPVGPLREPARRLAEVDAVLCNGASEDSLRGYGLVLQPAALVNLATGERQPLDYFPASSRLHGVAGIGNPQRFFDSLEALGWQPIPHAFADHSEYSAGQLDFGTDLPLLMTEKDAVKCRAFARPNWWYLEVSALPSAAFVDWFDRQLATLLPSAAGH